MLICLTSNIKLLLPNITMQKQRGSLQPDPTKLGINTGWQPRFKPAFACRPKHTTRKHKADS